MRIGNKIFPYPIINSNELLNDFDGKKFCVEIDTENNQLIQDSKNIIIKNIRIECTSNYINELIKQNLLKVNCIVECSSTMYRNIFPISTTPIDKIIDLKLLKDKVTISAYGYVDTDNFQYETDEFSEDFHGYSFELDRYDVVAVDDGFIFTVDKDYSKDNKVSSIFTICCDNDISNQDLIQHTASPDKIVIYLGKEAFDQYYSMKDNEYISDILFSIICIPVLTTCLEDIKKESKEMESLDDIIEHNHWFNSIIVRYKDVYNKEMTKEELEELRCFECAQKMMNYSNVSAIKTVFSLIKPIIGGENADESN